MRLLVLLALTALPTAAQDRAEGAAGGVLSTQPFGEPWTANPGVAGRLSFSLHGGVADGTMRWLPFTSVEPETPDFDLVTATLGWGPRVRFGRAELTAVARLGAATFWFDDGVPQFAGNEREVEVALGGALRAQVVAGRAVLWAEGEALRIALRDPETLPSLSAGVGIRFDMPPVVRRWLDE